MNANKPPTSSKGPPSTHVTHYVVKRGSKTCALALFSLHEQGCLVAGRPGEPVASFRVELDGNSRFAQLEKAKRSARRAIRRTEQIIRTVQGTLLQDVAARLLSDRGAFKIVGIRE